MCIVFVYCIPSVILLESFYRASIRAGVPMIRFFDWRGRGLGGGGDLAGAGIKSPIRWDPKDFPRDSI